MDEQALRDVLAASRAPVTVVTTMRDERPADCTVSAFMSLSLSPRMIAVALDRHSSMRLADAAARFTSDSCTTKIAADEENILDRSATRFLYSTETVVFG